MKGSPDKRASRASRDFASLSRIAGVFLRFHSIGRRFFAWQFDLLCVDGSGAILLLPYRMISRFLQRCFFASLRPRAERAGPQNRTGAIIWKVCVFSLFWRSEETWREP